MEKLINCSNNDVISFVYCVWQKNMCILPDDLKSFFLTTNGLLMQWSIKFDGDNENTSKPFLNLSNFSVHRIAKDGWSVVNNSYRAIFVSPWKMVSVSVRYLFYQLMDGKIKTWTLCFPAKENPNMEKALFDWPILLQYDVKAKYRLISRRVAGMKFFHPSVHLTNQN